MILNTDTRRVCRLNEIIAVYEKENIHATKYEKLEKLSMPSDLQLVKHIDVPYSSLDHTRHVNNAEYIKWICDSIEEICKPRFTGRKEIAELSINYLKETKYADHDVYMLRHIDGDKYYFQLTNSNGVSVNAIVGLK